MQLNQEIEKVKEAQLAGYGRGGATEQNMQLNLGALAALDAADLSNNGECRFKHGSMLCYLGGVGIYVLCFDRVILQSTWYFASSPPNFLTQTAATQRRGPPEPAGRQ